MVSTEKCGEQAISITKSKAGFNLFVTVWDRPREGAVRPSREREQLWQR